MCRGVFRGGARGARAPPSAQAQYNLIVYLGPQDQLLACSMAVLPKYFLIQLVLATC